MNATPFLIKVPLTTPVLMTNGYLTLDGILAMAHESMTGRPARPEDIPLAEDGGVMKGSAAFFQQGAASSKTMFGRLSIPELGEAADMALPRRGGKLIIDQASGEFRAWQTKFLLMDTPRVFWFGVGDPDRVVDLLKAIPGVGRKATLGYGSINHDAIQVDEVPDCSFSFKGKPARPLPLSMWHGGPAQQAMASVAHPYWDSPRVPCVVPATRFFAGADMRASAVTP